MSWRTMCAHIEHVRRREELHRGFMQHHRKVCVPLVPAVIVDIHSNFLFSGCSNVPVDCNDDNMCTNDSCDTVSGLCLHSSVVCNDNIACTNDTCATF